MLHQFDLSGTGLNRHIGYEASVLHSKPSDNFGEVTITGLASVDQRLARNRYFIYESISFSTLIEKKRNQTASEFGHPEVETQAKRPLRATGLMVKMRTGGRTKQFVWANDNLLHSTV